jgi:carbonic anhydrase
MSEANNEESLLPAHLVTGYQSFLSGRFHTEHTRYRRLAYEGQRPATMLIACSDSRVGPEIVFDAHPGEIFVVRNVAALIPPHHAGQDSHGVLAALEYAVMRLKVAHIVAVGHARCGGVRAFAEHKRDPAKAPITAGDYVGRWMENIAPAVEAIDDHNEPIDLYAERLGRAVVGATLGALRSYAFIAERERNGALRLHGAYFDMADGSLSALDEASALFMPIAPADRQRAIADPGFAEGALCPCCGAPALTR